MLATKMIGREETELLRKKRMKSQSCIHRNTASEPAEELHRQEPAAYMHPSAAMYDEKL